MSESDDTQDLEEVLQVHMKSCGAEKASLQTLGGDVKMEASSLHGGENKDEKSDPRMESGKARRKKRRLRNEPESIIGEIIVCDLATDNSACALAAYVQHDS